MHGGCNFRRNMLFSGESATARGLGLDPAALRVLAEPWNGGLVAYLLGLPVGREGDDVLVFEVDRGEVSDDLVLASDDLGRVTDRARVTLEEALANLKPALHKVVHMLQELSPDETLVEFGLKIGGETGVIIAKGTAEVNFTVRMSWRSGERHVAS
jgi:hypothetical protein